MNLCRPDAFKSCAACCGLYNVPDATRPALYAKLERRTQAFRDVDRSPHAIADYETWVRATEAVKPIDEAIHVCEFTGFLDPFRRIVGCQLHPTAPGNRGVDLRGLCHYGSMACKSFFCPAWEEIPARIRDIVCLLLDDWHLYGLVITDVIFVRAIFRVLEDRVRSELNPLILHSSDAEGILRSMLSWKDSWPFASGSCIRGNRYYFKAASSCSGPMHETAIESLLECLSFTFGMKNEVQASLGFVHDTIEAFAETYQ